MTQKEPISELTVGKMLNYANHAIADHARTKAVGKEAIAQASGTSMQGKVATDVMARLDKRALGIHRANMKVSAKIDDHGRLNSDMVKRSRPANEGTEMEDENIEQQVDQPALTSTDLIDSIMSGDAVKAQEIFNQIAASKTLEAMADRKEQIAQSMYEPEVEVADTVEPEETTTEA